MDSETGALSVDDAVALLSEEAVKETPKTPENDTTDAPDDDAPEAASEDGSDAGEETDDEGQGDDPDGQDEPELPAIEPPQSWDADGKERFARLPREDQEYLVAREAERDRGVSVAQQRAAEARQRAEQEAAQIVAAKPLIVQAVAKAQQQFQSRWEGMDATAWHQLAQTDPTRFVQAKAAYDADVQAIQQVEAAQQQAEAIEWQSFAQTQTARLAEVAPHIAGDAKVQAEVFDYIAKSTPNFSPEQRRWVSAEEMLIAWKAQQYDAAKAPQPKPEGKRVVSAKPSAPPTPLKQRQRSQAEAAFQKAPTIENALKLLS